MDTRDNHGKWLPGVSGNPNGAPKGRRKIMTDALMIALTEAADDGDRTKARAIADKLVSKALEGDVQAMKEAFDRTEGKAPQPIEGGDPERPVAVAVSWLPPQE